MTLDVDKALCEAVQRAEVYQFFNPLTMTVYLITHNLEKPLTINEEILIRQWFNTHLPEVKVVFGKVKKEEE